MSKPIIGIGSDVEHLEGKRDRSFAFLTYVESVRKAGAIPVIIPPQPENAAEIMEQLDGILLAGGEDCDPSLYNEERHPMCVDVMDARRQANDLALAKFARQHRIPTLGICLGLQMMNVASGGSLIQDINSQFETEIEHASQPESRARHDIIIQQGTQLSTLLPAIECNVNSSHHQAIGRVGEGLRVTAHAPDGLVEGLEDPKHPFYIGVQWHPEDMNGEHSSTALFDAFVKAAREYSQTRNARTAVAAE